MSTSRRKFIKISALGLGGAAAATSTLNMFGANSYLEELANNNIAKQFTRMHSEQFVSAFHILQYCYRKRRSAYVRVVTDEGVRKPNSRSGAQY